MVGQAGRGDEVVEVVRRLAPDVALVDIEMPGLDGLSAAAVLTQEVPDTHVLVLTTFGRPGYLRRAMEAGALGFVVKDAPADRLVDAVRRVARANGWWIRRWPPRRWPTASARSPDASATCSSPPVTGATVADIAARLFLSEGTIRNYLSAAIAKTGTRNRAAALRVADEQGWL